MARHCRVIVPKGPRGESVTTEDTKSASPARGGLWLRSFRLLILVSVMTGCVLLTLCGANGTLLLTLTSHARDLPRLTSFPSATSTNFSIGQAAPTLTLPDLNGQPVVLSGHQDQVMLLAFWATWCTPCLAELDHLQTLYEAQLPGLEIVTVCQEAHDADSIRAFVRERGWDFLVLHDSELTTVRHYQVGAVPRTLLIDREGVVRYDHLGYGSGQDAELDAAIDALLPTARLGEE